jgi:DNA-binding FadR family transcriptional regulator
VREALQVLVGKELIEVRPGKGYFLRRTDAICGSALVEAPGIEEIQDLTEARIVIEGACAAFAASRITPTDTVRIEAFLSEMETKAASASSIYLDALKLHLMIAEAAHNHTLNEILRVIIPRIGAYGAKIAAEIPDHAPVDAALHRELWEKIRTGDPDVARAAMEVHIRDAASLYRLPYESPTTQGTSLPSRKGEPPSHPRPTRLRKGRL